MNNNFQRISKNQRNISNGGSSCYKLKALIKKNLLVLRRNKGTTLCEIIFPILLMIIVYEIRKAFDINEYDYDKNEVNTTNFINHRSFANVDFYNPDINTTDNTSFTWHKLKILPALFVHH